MDNKENIFLAKLQLLCNTFDEIDKIVENNPSEQQRIDYEISDYLHLLQNEDLDDSSMLKISKKLKSARLKRVVLQNTAALIKTYNDNKQRVVFTNTRIMFRSNIKNTMNRLHQDYNYRVLEESDIKELKNTKVMKKEDGRKTNGGRNKPKAITKEQMIECLEKGMRTNEIAEKYNTSASNVSHLKADYGLKKKKGD